MTAARMVRVSACAWALGVAAINPNAKHCEATERAAILPKQWPYSVIARSPTLPPVLAWRDVVAAT
jgi:hypothetical protein